MEKWIKDVAYALRGLRGNLGFAIITTATIALGIASCTAIFSVVNAVLLRPLPYSDAERLVFVWGELRARNVKDFTFSPPDFRDLQLETNVFDDIAAVSAPVRTPISEGSGDPEQIRVVGATWNAFKLLGARVLVGRDFTENDATPQPTPTLGQPLEASPRLPLIAILSHGLWQRRYGANPNITGTSVDLGGIRAEIVGVLRPEFELLFPSRVNMDRMPDMFTAMRANYETANRNNVGWRVIGRLKPNVPIKSANAQVERLASDLRTRFPMKQAAGQHFYLIPMFEDLIRDTRPAMVALMGAVVFVLLIACANVANLLAVRASARSRELSLRTALGASRAELMRQMLVESLVIATIGTLLGVVLANAGMKFLLVLAPKDIPRLDAVAMDWRVLAFAVVAGGVTAILCGFGPALRGSRADVIDVLRARGRSAGLQQRRWLQTTLVVTEVTLSFVLLIGAGLMLRSFVALSHVYPGYDPNHVLTFFLQPRSTQPDQRAAFMSEVRQQLLAIPGVQNVTAATPLPLDGEIVNARWGTSAALADPSLFRQGDFRFVLPGYFETMRTRLIAGRVFEDADNQLSATRKQVIIDELVAAKAFPNDTAVGKRLLLRVTTPEAEWFEVIGVVEHQKHASLAVNGPECLFIVDGSVGHGAAGRWAIRTDGDPADYVTAVRAAVARVNAQLPLGEVQPMSAFVDRAMAPVRFTSSLIGVFATIAILLAAIGLYGVLSTIVRQRTAEIGMRVAFGADRASILSLVVGQGLWYGAIGVVIGLIGAIAVTGLMGSLLVGVSPVDPATFVAIILLFAVVIGVASWIPARRAARVQPMVALRQD